MMMILMLDDKPYYVSSLTEPPRKGEKVKFTGKLYHVDEVIWNLDTDEIHIYIS